MPPRRAADLFEDASFTGHVESAAPTFSGGYSLSGPLAGVELGTVTLVVNGAVVAGTVRTPEATCRIRPAGGGLHAVSQVDLSRLPPLGEPIRVHGRPAAVKTAIQEGRFPPSSSASTRRTSLTSMDNAPAIASASCPRP